MFTRGPEEHWGSTAFPLSLGYLEGSTQRQDMVSPTFSEDNTSPWAENKL